MTWALGLLLQLNSELSVETGSPDALCPDLHQTRAAVRVRLGTLRVAAGTGFRARYTIGHSREGSPRDFVHLELFDAAGEPKLERDLPMQECASMAEVIALVLDRYFRSLAGPEVEGPSPNDRTASEPLNADKQPELAAPPRRIPSDRPHATVVAAELGLDSDRDGIAGGLRLDQPLWKELHMAFAAIFPFDERSQALAGGGRAQARAFELHGNMTLGGELGGGLRAYVGPGFSAVFERGSTTGLPSENSRDRLLWGVGVNAGVTLSLSAQWRLLLSGAALARLPGSADFVVSGSEVLEPKPWSAYLGLGIGYAFAL
jgi:hypothetical protein